jgi:hypothetical protein
MRRTALRAGLAAGCLIIAFGTGVGLRAVAQGTGAQDAKPAPADGDNNAAAQPAAPGPPATAAPSEAPPQATPAAPAEKASEKPPETAAPPAAAQPEQPPVLPVASVLDKHLIIGILGKDVKSAKGEDMGRIVDVIVDRSGQTRAAIIDFGGFLGVGSRRIAVDWNALHFEPQQKGDQVTLDLTRDQVRAAPEYKEDKPVVVLGPSGAAEPIPYD